MNVSNIKISIHFQDDCFQKLHTNEKIIFKEKKWSIIHYIHSPRIVNVTGIKSEEEISQVIQFLERKYNNKCIKHQIDSIMITHKDYKSIQMIDIVNNLKSITNLYYADYNPELFTGIYLKPYDRTYPTVNMFYTGSFQLLGGKSFEKIHITFNIIKKLIEKCENVNY